VTSIFFHANVIRYSKRPWTENLDKLLKDNPEPTEGARSEAVMKDVVLMNEGLVKNWNEVVKPEDTVYCLGDFSMAFRSVELYTRRLNGIKHLIMGNHDMCHPAHKKSRTPENQKIWIQKYLDNGWDTVVQHMTLDIPGVGTVNLSHLPYKNGGDSSEDDEGYEERHTRHRLDDDGKILLHGHVHEKFLTRITSKGTLMINVGVDVWNYRPVSEQEIIDVIKTTGI
jgi:calcineurin-like phosphoesterase family protein